MPVNGKCRKFDFPPTIRRYPRFLYCGAVFADGITSANVVGYQTKEILADDYTMFGIQFQGTDGEGVKFKDLGIDAIGGPSVAESDNLLVWRDGVYYTYYYGYWGTDESATWDNRWWEDFGSFEDASDKTIESGVASWYLRRGDATTISFTSPLAE